MKKHRDYLGIITVVLALLLTASGGIYIWKIISDNKKTPDDDPVIVETTVNIVVGNAQVFRFDDLDFQFVIAELDATSNKALDIGLGIFSTSEGIALNNTDFYRTKLSEMGYTLDKYDLATDFVSDKLNLKRLVFIPVMDKNATSITLTANLAKPIVLPINLAVADGTKAEVGLLSTDEITDKTTYKLTLGPIISLNGKPMIQTSPSGDTQPVDFSDTSNLFAVQFTIEGLNGVTIGLEDAKYTVDGSTNDAMSLDSGYSVEGYTNSITKSYAKKTTGYIYLQLNSTTQTIIKQNGTLKLKLIGSTNWITVFYTK
ncbi:MAG: hypothetical protein WBL80_08130 [Erysipelotrichaceae bacterium]